MAKAKYEKIAEILKKEILRGVMPPDARLPKIIELAARFEVSYVTMSNAIQLLSDMGYVKTIQGNGIFVNSNIGGDDKKEITYLAPIEGDLYGRCFRTAQNCLEESNYKLNIAVSADRLFAIYQKNPEKMEKILREYSSNMLIVDGTRHFPFPALKKINPSGRGVYFFMHCECGDDEFPEAVRIIPDFYKVGFAAAEKLHKKGAEKLFMLTFEALNSEKNRFAGNPESTYDSKILAGMSEYARINRLGKIDVCTSGQDYIENFDNLVPYFNSKCGFMAVGDSRAHTLYRYARHHNVKINEDWFVIGLGKTDWCDIMEPHLESVSVREIPLMRQLVSEILQNNHSKHILWQPEL